MSEDIIAVARGNVEAYNAGDWDRLGAMLTPDSVYDELATGRRIQGPDAIVEVNQGWKATFPDSQGTVTEAFACDDRVVLCVTWEGTHEGALPLPGGAEIAPTGRGIEVSACQLVRVADGKITELKQYFDMLGMLEQLGTVSEEALSHTG